MKNYKIGDIVLGRVTGIKPYGIFLNVDDCYSGMIHISEITDRFVEKVETYATYGETLKVKILDIDEETKHMNLSLRALSRSRKSNKLNYKSVRPLLKIGYKTLEDKLDQWIKEKNK